jgi:prepilin peptidase CpaA
MDPHFIFWTLALLLTVIAATIDWRSRRIPNWLTVPGILAGLAAHTVIPLWQGSSVWQGLKMSLSGAALALVLLLPFVLLRAMGAGDWKLMGAVGAILGPILFLFVLLGSIFGAGLMAAVQAIRAKRMKETLLNMVVLVQGFVTFGLRAHSEISLDNPALMKLPFGVSVAASTIGCFVVAYWAQWVR